MNAPDLMDRFHELAAGHALRDLALDESQELASLGSQLGNPVDFNYELLVATLDTHFLGKSSEPMPAHLTARLRNWTKTLDTPAPQNLITPSIPAWRKTLRNPLTGWAAAAAVAVLRSSAHRNHRQFPQLSPPLASVLKRGISSSAASRVAAISRTQQAKSSGAIKLSKAT
jgi:hypothetical protein